MKNYLKTLIATLFPFTVDGVLARFERDVERLKTLGENHRAVADMHEEMANDFYEMSAASHDEADRAERVAAKIASLID